MASPLTLHVGLPKTASTYLQDAVFPRLRRHLVIDRPRTALLAPRGAHAPAEARGFATNLLRLEPDVWDAMGEALLDDLLGAERGRRPVLVTDEAFGRGGTRALAAGAHLRALAAGARARGFSGLRIVVFVRRQAEWLASHYAQVSDRRSRAGQRDFERFVAVQTDPANGLYRFGSLLRYDGLFDALSGAVDSRDELLVAPYEALEADRDGFLARLTGFLGDELAPVGTGGRDGRNVRREDEAAWRLRAPARRGPLGRLLGTGGGDGPGTIRLTPALRERVARAYAPANVRLAERTGLDLAGFGYPVKPP